MVLFHNATRERETNSPSTLLRRESRLEDARAEPRWYAWSVVGDSDADTAVREGRSRKADAAAAAGERVDRILREHLDSPFEQHRITIHGRRAAIMRDIDGDGVRERR